MALEDIFGSGAQFKGLLSDEDIGSAKNDALLNASLALLAAGGPSSQKIGIGQALAQAYGQGRKAFQGGIESGLQTQDLRAKREQAMQEAEQRKQLQSMFAGASTPEQKLQAYSAARDLASARGDGKLASYYDDIIKRMEGEEFTLGEGQVRFKGGKEVAKGPAKDTTFSGDFANISQAMFGVADPAKLAPEQRTQVMRAAEGYRRAGGTNVNVNTEKSFLNELAKGSGEAIMGQRTQAEGAVNSLQTIDRLKNVINSDKVMAGPGTNFRQFGLQVGTVLGVTGKDAQETLTNTREAIQSLAKLQLDAAAQMKGQGQITESERALLARADSGDIDSMTKPEIQRLVSIFEKTNRYKINNYNQRVKQLGGMKGAENIMPFLEVQQPQQSQRVRAYNPATGRIE